MSTVEIPVSKILLIDPEPYVAALEGVIDQYLSKTYSLATPQQRQNVFREIIVEVAKTIIDRRCRWQRNNKHMTTHDIMERFIDVEYHHWDELFDKAQEALRELTTDIVGFIGNDDWHMYFVNLSVLGLAIEKTIDYRIFQWTKEHGHKYKAK